MTCVSIMTPIYMRKYNLCLIGRIGDLDLSLSPSLPPFHRDFIIHSKLLKKYLFAKLTTLIVFRLICIHVNAVKCFFLFWLSARLSLITYGTVFFLFKYWIIESIETFGRIEIIKYFASVLRKIVLCSYYLNRNVRLRNTGITRRAAMMTHSKRTRNLQHASRGTDFVEKLDQPRLSVFSFCLLSIYSFYKLLSFMLLYSKTKHCCSDTKWQIWTMCSFLILVFLFTLYYFVMHNQKISYSVLIYNLDTKISSWNVQTGKNNFFHNGLIVRYKDVYMYSVAMKIKFDISFKYII